MNFFRTEYHLINLDNITSIALDVNSIIFNFISGKTYRAEYATSKIAEQHFKNILP